MKMHHLLPALTFAIPTLVGAADLGHSLDPETHSCDFRNVVKALK